MKNRFKAIPAVYILLIKNDEILLMRRFNTGYSDGLYSLPSGHVEEGESPKQAIIREAKEEVGAILSEKDLVFANVLYRAKADETGERIDFFFVTKIWEGLVENKEPDKCDHLGWFLIDNLPRNMVPCVREAMEMYKKGHYYQELGW